MSTNTTPTHDANPPRTRRLSRRHRIAVTIAAAVVLPLAAAALAQAVATAVDAHRFPPPGHLSDVGGGLRLHVNCTGRGDPTVVLDAGMGGTSLDWSLVQPEVSTFTRVCSYDRAGLGWSDPGPLPRTSQRESAELRALLLKEGITGPVVLAGHSLGGMNARVYAQLFPEQVVGMVLVDATHEDLGLRFPQPALRKLASDHSAGYLVSLAAYLGYARLHSSLTKDYGWLPPDAQGPYHAFDSLPESHRTAYDEYVAFNESAARAHATKWTADIPLLVLTAGNNIELELPAELNRGVNQAWRELQADLASRSPRGRQIIVEGSSHFIHCQRPQAVVDAIRQVVAESRR